jgi:Flp pilus assembly protein TadG
MERSAFGSVAPDGGRGSMVSEQGIDLMYAVSALATAIVCTGLIIWAFVEAEVAQNGLQATAQSNAAAVTASAAAAAAQLETARASHTAASDHVNALVPMVAGVTGDFYNGLSSNRKVWTADDSSGASGMKLSFREGEMNYTDINSPLDTIRNSRSPSMTVTPPSTDSHGRLTLQFFAEVQPRTYGGGAWSWQDMRAVFVARDPEPTVEDGDDLWYDTVHHHQLNIGGNSTRVLDPTATLGGHPPVPDYRVEDGPEPALGIDASLTPLWGVPYAPLEHT